MKKKLKTCLGTIEYDTEPITVNYSEELVNYHNEVIDTIDAIMRKTNSKITYEELKSLRTFLGAYFEVHYLCKIMKGDSNE